MPLPSPDLLVGELRALLYHPHPTPHHWHQLGLVLTQLDIALQDAPEVRDHWVTTTRDQLAASPAWHALERLAPANWVNLAADGSYPFMPCANGFEGSLARLSQSELERALAHLSPMSSLSLIHDPVQLETILGHICQSDTLTALSLSTSSALAIDEEVLLAHSPPANLHTLSLSHGKLIPERLEAMLEQGAWLTGLHHLDLSWNPLEATGLDRLMAHEGLSGLRSLTLDYTPFDEHTLAQLCHSPTLGNLDHLSLQLIDPGESGLAPLRKARFRHSLEHLDFSFCIGETPLDLTALIEPEAFPSLTSLAMSGCTLDADAMLAFCRSPLARQLTSLDLSHIDSLPAEVWRELFSSGRLAALHAFDLATCALSAPHLTHLLTSLQGRAVTRMTLARNTFDARVTHTLFTRLDLSRLTELDLCDCKLEARSWCAALEDISGDTLLLEMLDLRDNALGNEAVLTILERIAPHSLNELLLNRTGLTPSTELAQALGRHPITSFGVADSSLPEAALLDLLFTLSPTLNQLDLSGAPLTADFFDALLCGALPSLTHLKLRGCALDDTILARIAQTPGIARLKNIDLSDNPDVSPDARSRLSRCSRHLSVYSFT